MHAPRRAESGSFSSERSNILGSARAAREPAETGHVRSGIPPILDRIDLDDKAHQGTGPSERSPNRGATRPDCPCGPVNDAG